MVASAARSPTTSFRPSRSLLSRKVRPDHILIETSGLALRKPLLKAFDWPEIRSRITVDGVIALADAEAVAAGRFAPDPTAVDAQRAADESLDHETPLSEVFEDQVCCADIVLLTKADLAGEAGNSSRKLAIAAETPRSVPMLAVTDGAIDPRLILGLNAAAEDDIAARPSHHDGEEIMSMTASPPSWSNCLKSPTSTRWLLRSAGWRASRTCCAPRLSRGRGQADAAVGAVGR